MSKTKPRLQTEAVFGANPSQSHTAVKLQLLLLLRLFFGGHPSQSCCETLQFSAHRWVTERFSPLQPLCLQHRRHFSHSQDSPSPSERGQRWEREISLQFWGRSHISSAHTVLYSCIFHSVLAVFWRAAGERQRNTASLHSEKVPLC